MSFQSNFMHFLIRASCLKRIIGTEYGMRNFVYHALPKKEASPPRGMTRRYRIQTYEFNDHPVHHVIPHNCLPSRHILYLHGGAYVAPIVRLHWNFLHRLMHRQSLQVTVPLYGLAPKYTHQEAFAFLGRVYRHLLQNNPPQNIIFMGDSSGGGLALALVQSLKESGLPQPGGVVMLSPWLDITLENPDIVKVEKRDPLLAVGAAREAGRIWSGGTNPRIPNLSPINGPVQGLAPLCLLMGTNDILMPDARKLRDKANAVNHPLRYLEYPSMFHAWMLLGFLPESKQALREVIDFINSL